MKFAYFPGCAALETVKEGSKASLKVAQKLGIELVDVPEFTCCGAGVLHEEDEDFSLAINARNFAIAEKMGLDIVTICNTCCLTMLQEKKVLDSSKEKRDKINAILKEHGHVYRGSVKIKHLLWVIVEDFGLDKLKEKIINPLKDLKVAPFYGCHIVRPFNLLGFEPEQNPLSLERLITTVGAQSINFRERLSCCGFHILLVEEDVSLRMTANILNSTVEAGADCIVTPCTLCHINLDAYQEMCQIKTDNVFNMPVLHLAQLIGLAMGMSHRELSLGNHFISTNKILEKVGR